MRCAAIALIVLLGGVGEGRAADDETARQQQPVYGIAPYFGPPSPDMQRPLLQSSDPLEHWPSQPRERDLRYYGFSFLYSTIESYARQRNDVDPVSGKRRSR